MPSRHAPIKKYNYERSLFRWVMSRHPEPFEEHGITTRTLERTPLAREAFYTSGWPGARALVQSSDESKYERTAFFDAIIERGLRGGTRFNIDHVTAEEKSKLGITVDRASGKFYLAAYGSPKARRNSTRRGSQTSSDGDGTEHSHHAVVKEVEEMLTAEIAAAGEHAEVILLKARTDPGSARGSKTINFSVSIRRRSSGEGGDSGRERGEGHGAGALPLPHTQAADAGGGKATNTPRSRVTKASQPGDGGSRASRDGSSPKQAHRSDSSASGNLALGRSVTTVGGGLGENRKGADEFSMQEAASKRRRTTTDAIFPNAPRLGAGMTPKHEPRPSMSGPSGKMDMRFGRPGLAPDANRGRVNKIVRVVDVPMSFLPGRVASMSQATMPPAHHPSSATMGGQYGAGGTSSPRGQPFSTTGGGNFSGLNECYQQQRPEMATGTGQMPPTAGTGEGGGGEGGGNGVVTAASMSNTSAIPAWQLHAASSMRTDDFGAQLVARTTAGRGGGETIGVEVGSNTGGTTGFGSMSTLSQQQQQQQQHQQQQHLSGTTTTFGQRMPTPGMGRGSPTTMLGQDSQSISGLNAYSAHVRQQAHATPSGNHGTWGANTRMGTSLSCGREPDEEDMDFLASFF